MTKVPELYKYRHFQKREHLTLLSRQELYFASPSEFDDPDDMGMPIRIDLAKPDEMIKLYADEILRRSPHLEASAAKKLASEYFAAHDPRDPSEMERMRVLTKESASEKFGICSLASTPNNRNMWEEYSEQHTGFCVGLDFDKLVAWARELRESERIEIIGRPVNYVDELPLLDIHTMSEADVTESLIVTKLASFSAEKEYRLATLNISGRPLTLDKSIISSVGLGACIARENKRTILEVVNEHYPGIMICQAKKCVSRAGAVKIEFERIN